MPNKTTRPKLTLGQAALVRLMDRYLKGLLDPFVSLLEIHSSCIFSKRLARICRSLLLKNNSTARIHLSAPFADSMEKHLTRGFGEGTDKPTTPIELLPAQSNPQNHFSPNCPKQKHGWRKWLR